MEVPSGRLALHAAGLAAVLTLHSPLAAQEPQEELDPYPSIDEIEDDEMDLRFLQIGQDRDYLRSERWRIVDQIEQAIPPLYEPVRPFHGYTLPPGAWRVGLSTTIAHNPGDFGRDSFYSLFFDDVEVDTQRTDLNISYGFETGGLRDMVLNLGIPYKFTRLNGTGHPWRIDNFEMTMDGSGEGLGDITLTLKKKWIDQANAPLNFATMTGLIFPTADDSQRFNSSQTLSVDGMSQPMAPPLDIFGTEPGETLLPRSLQPGNGAWGVRLGFGTTRQLERSALHGGAVFDYLFDTTDDITPGHELRYGLSYVIPPFESDHLTLDLALFGFWKGDEEFPGQVTHPVRDPGTGGPIIDPGTGMPLMVTTDRPDFEHGNATFFSPSLVFVPAPGVRFIFSPAVRVIEPNKGPSPQWMATFGFTYTF